MNKIGIMWIIIAILYFVYTVILAKHGFMLINTTAIIVMIIIGICYLIKK